MSQQASWLRMAVIYGSNAITPVFTKVQVLNGTNQSRAPSAFDLEQYLEDEYAYLEYPLRSRSHHDEPEDIIIYHSPSQELSYDFCTMNPMNKLLSAMLVD